MIRHECGLLGIYGHEEAARLTYFGLYAQQHRGQESAGIVTIDDAWDAIEDDVSSDKTKTSMWKWVGIATGALLFLILYTLVVLQIAGFHWR